MIRQSVSGLDALFNKLARDLRTNEDVCPAKPVPTFADRALFEPEYCGRFGVQC
jgi:hypothetical protein